MTFSRKQSEKAGPKELLRSICGRSPTPIFNVYEKNKIESQSQTASNFLYDHVCQDHICKDHVCQDPSSIYSWSIGHILEHDFFCLGHLGCAGSKGKKSGFEEF